MTEPGAGSATVVDLSAVRGAEWTRLLDRAHRHLERHDGAVAGAISLPAPTDAERRLVIGLTGAYRSGGARSLRVDMTTLEARVRALTGSGLVTVCASVNGRPVRHRATERAAEETALSALAAALGRSKHAAQPWFPQWRERLISEGALTRLVRTERTNLVHDLVAVLDALPAADVPLPVLAERVTGDTKALAGTRLASLVLSALACQEGVPAPEGVDERRALWDGAGVIVDDLASHVLVAGIRASGSELAGELTATATRGHPRRVTLFELARSPLRFEVDAVWVCENPSVFRSALASMGTGTPSLVCTEGEASSACWRLLRAAKASGCVVRWRSDFDYVGLRMTETAIRRLGAIPWRMSAADLQAAVAGGAPGVEGLRGSPPALPSWDAALLPELQRIGVAVMEERLIRALLADLR